MFMNKQVSQSDQIRNLCREKYGSKWWDVSPELKKKRKEEAKKALAKPKPNPPKPKPSPVPSAVGGNDWSVITHRPKIVKELYTLLAYQHLPEALKWPLKWSSRKTALGHCVYQPSAIFLSTIYINAAQTTIESVTETILHEIAHALTPGDGHGKLWKATALRIGCSGARCGEAYAAYKYTVFCPCGVVNVGRHRKSNLCNRICGVCKEKLQYKNN
jgi:predicted SprT family Zn-dependent metalloprotease